jgi:hypothetical protein
MITAYCVGSTLLLLLLGVVWSKDGGINMVLKFLLITLAIIGVVTSMMSYGLVFKS